MKLSVTQNDVTQNDKLKMSIISLKNHDTNFCYNSRPNSMFVKHSDLESKEYSGRVPHVEGNVLSKEHNYAAILSLSRPWVLHGSVRDVEKAVLHNRK